MGCKLDKSTRVITVLQASLLDPVFIVNHRRQPTAFTRNRKLTFATVVVTILHMAKRSLQIECNLLGDRLMTEPVSKQAFSKARYKISHTGFKALNDQLLEESYRDDHEGLWYGYRVFGIDGSTIHLPKSAETEKYFGRWDRGQNRNENCPIIGRVSEVVELTTGIIVSAEIAPWSSGERMLAKEQVKAVSKLFHRLNQHKQLFVFDRGYSSKDLMRLILDSESDFMFRMPSKFNKKIDDLAANGDADCLLELAPELPTLRLVVRKLPSKELCILLTSLVDTSLVTADDLFRLYWLRWTGCEEGYKKQKVSLELENFIGLGVEAVLQEFWATVVAVNLFQIQCLTEEGPWNVDNPPHERINRNVVFGSLREDIFHVLLGEISIQGFQEKFQRIARRSKVKVRPGRRYSRDGVNKPKRHHVFRRTC